MIWPTEAFIIHACDELYANELHSVDSTKQNSNINIFRSNQNVIVQDVDLQVVLCAIFPLTVKNSWILTKL